MTSFASSLCDSECSSFCERSMIVSQMDAEQIETFRTITLKGKPMIY